MLIWEMDGARIIKLKFKKNKRGDFSSLFLFYKKLHIKYAYKNKNIGGN